MNWYSLYLPSEDSAAITEALRSALSSAGYTLYNPFGPMPGLSYRESARLFVAPPRDGWIRVVASPEHLAPVASALSQLVPCLEAGFNGGAIIQLYRAGEKLDDPRDALSAYLRPGKSPADLVSALQAPPLGFAAENETVADVPLDILPADARALSDKVNLKQASGLFNRLSEGLSKRTGQTASKEEAARALLRSSALDWNSPGGRQIRALMACLNVPDNWRTPDFVALRDAYQLHARRRRSPNADLYPGDAEAMAAVPDALDYTPVYGGRNA
jgi:hypothetical protein